MDGGKSQNVVVLLLFAASTHSLSPRHRPTQKEGKAHELSCKAQEVSWQSSRSKKSLMAELTKFHDKKTFSFTNYRISTHHYYIIHHTSLLSFPVRLKKSHGKAHEIRSLVAKLKKSHGKAHEIRSLVAKLKKSHDKAHEVSWQSSRSLMAKLMKSHGKAHEIRSLMAKLKK
ncbi:hypothetical protein VNO80_06208 [Phaseolus coccineus]|uniref:Uncharacterized protein n=1 Tax=Phaseolus coccineus TaxID=3886 RepID=A0AAN9NHP5_PHACN